MLIRYFFIAFLLIPLFSFSQSTYRFGSIPTFNLNKGFEKGWEINFKSEFRSVFRQGTKRELPELENQYVHTDFTIMGAKKVGLSNRLIFGVMARVRPDQVVQRYIQQYVMVRRYTGYRMSFRFAADQTFDEFFELRLRYRTSAEIPLEGLVADKKEFYLKINQEFLNNFENSTYDIELRVVPSLGYRFTDANKLEFGLDYRIDSFLNAAPRHTAFVSVNWYVKI